MRSVLLVYWLFQELCARPALGRVLLPTGGQAGGVHRNASCFGTMSRQMPNLKQCDPRWKCLPFVGDGSTSTCHATACVKDGGSDKQENNICGAGCGVVSTAMILQYYGHDVEPPAIATYLMTHGFRNDLMDRPGATCSGVSHTAICAAGEQWGLHCGRSDSFSVADEWLRTGPIVAHVRPTDSGECKFTKVGHYMVIVSKDEQRDSYVVSDPNSCDAANTFGTKKDLSENCQLMSFIRLYKNSNSSSSTQLRR